MPRQDKTGLNGIRPKTGRGMGYCGWGEPIIESPIDAIKTFVDMGLDYLVCGNILIKKS